MKTVFVQLGVATVLLVLPALAQNPCAGQHARALVLGGGGSKGAFETGAAYHLIVHRGRDFAEFSGTSVGALNAAVLAQAGRSLEPETSLAKLKGQAEALVSMWQSIRSSKDVIRGRPLASLRFGLFGMEATRDLAPLRKLIAAKVDLQRLNDGRELRVGTVSLHDGVYHEFVLNTGGRSSPKTLDFLLASAALPMIAPLPRIASNENDEHVQFADGGLRHNAPIRSYFVQCSSAANPSRCRSTGNHGLPPHQRTEQLFVVTTKPYEPDAEAVPVLDTTVFRRRTHQITNGRKVMARAVSIVMDAVYHQDLDSMLLANNLLKWRDVTYTSQGVRGNNEMARERLDHECCRETRTEFRATADKPYHFVDSGLPNVYLVGIRYFKCECGEVVAEIPAITQLMVVIGRDAIAKPESLSGAEIRFLRKRLGIKSSEFAKNIGIKPETLSRIENGHQPAGEGTDKAIRLYYVLASDDPVLDKARQAILDALKSWTPAKKKSKKLVARVKDNEWETMPIAA